jgi:hypothetical protein
MSLVHMSESMYRRLACAKVFSCVIHMGPSNYCMHADCSYKVMRKVRKIIRPI